MKDPKNIETRVWRGEIPLKSVYTAGLGGQLFFEALKERGELLATRCGTCNQVYMPARAFCECCLAELTEKVKVGPDGTLLSFTLGWYDRDGNRLQSPLALGLVALDGATTSFLHRLLKVTSHTHVRISARVKVQLKPKPMRTGSILDIEGFRLL